jgi:hypothetical protein
MLRYTQDQLNQSGRQLFGVVFEKQRFRSTTPWLKETYASAPQQRGWNLIPLSWRNRDARS